MALTEQQRIYQREWKRRRYKESPEERARISEASKKRRQGAREWFNEYRKTLACSECGENHPAALDFHHLDPNIKDFPVAAMIHGGYSKERILREVAKCIVLCANCHRKLHWNERQV